MMKDMYIYIYIHMYVDMFVVDIDIMTSIA